MTKTKVVVGVDYSITSPAACAMTSDGKILAIRGLAQTKKQVGKHKIDGYEIELLKYPDWKTPEERMHKLSEFFIEFILLHKADVVVIEDYAFGATGQVFDIGENCGLLKHKIWKCGIPIIKLSPGTIKKHATGKGNATKEKMYEFWLKDSSDLKELLASKATLINSPIGDIVDARFIASAGIPAITVNE